jgi:hypothetical protein
MRKLIVTSIIIGLLGAGMALPAEAGKRKKVRKAEGAYENPAIGIPGVVGTSNAGGAFEFGITSKEAFIDVEIVDDGGQPVMATMSQDTDPSTTQWEIFATLCGKTEEPVPIEPGIAVRVSVYTMPGPDHPTCTGPASSGVIKASFSNVP